jgi:hypothetical protein
MKNLPNGVKVFNGTPHPITFWSSDWDAPVSVPTDEVINANPHERIRHEGPQFTTVVTEFTGTDEGEEIIDTAYANGADVVIGSLIAAQAYPERVYAMVACAGYERVPPDEKRMRPDKFTVFLS